MFNTDQLSEQFKKKAAEIQPPIVHEERIRELYEAHRKRLKPSAKYVRRTMLKIVLALALASLITGFTSYIWYQYSDNRVSFQYTQPVNPIYDDALSSKIYHHLAAIKSKLEIGETALVYLPEMFSLMSKDLLVAVANPVVYTKQPEWESILAQNTKEYKLPSSISSGMHFVGGQEEAPFGSFVSLESNSLLPELKRESEENDGKVVWRKRDSEKLGQVFTTIYHNDRQEEIYVSMQLVKQKTDIKILSGFIERDTMNVNGVELYYFKTEPFFLSDSNMVQEIQWLETYVDYTLTYSVGSTVPSFSKEKLVEIANTMINGLK